jgi:hypothetical protein
MSYPHTIEDKPFYFSQCSLWQPHGIAFGFSNNGQPTPDRPGRFTATVRALAITDPTDYGGDFATSGTFRELLSLCYGTFSAGYLQTFHILDPRTNGYITVMGRLELSDLLNSYGGGAALEDVQIVVTNAFIPDESRAGYYGGDPSPITTEPPYIPGDPLPTPDPMLTYGWGIGGYGRGLYGQGEGV